MENNLSSELINLGGGFPIASVMKEKRLVEIFQEIYSTLKNEGYGKIKCIFEPGRYIIGDAGCCISKVIKTNINGKKNKNNYIIVDSGTYILPRFAKNPLRFYCLNRPLSHYNFPIDIFGIIPSEDDVLVKNYNFIDSIKVGDYILITNCGAYSYTFSNRFPYSPPNHYIINGSIIKNLNTRNP